MTNCLNCYHFGWECTVDFEDYDSPCGFFKPSVDDTEDVNEILFGHNDEEE